MPPIPAPTPGARIELVRADRVALGATVAAWLLEAVRSGPDAVVGLAIGDSTLPLYASLPQDDSWTTTRILPVDELVPPPARADARFVNRLRAALPRAIAPCVEAIRVDPDPATAAHALAARLAREPLRAVVLGLGPDGHVAFNQPGTAADAPARVVHLDAANLARLGDVAPADAAVTIGMRELLAAERVALVVAGEGKRPALDRVLDGPAGADVPASLLRRHPALTVFADEALWN